MQVEFFIPLALFNCISINIIMKIHLLFLIILIFIVSPIQFLCNDCISKFTISITKNFILIFIVYYLFNKINIKKFNYEYGKSIKITIIGIYSLCLFYPLLANNFWFESIDNLKLILLSFFSIFILVFLEEIIFRIYLFNYINSLKKFSLKKSIIITNLCFSFTHLPNSLLYNSDIASILGQLIISFFIGLLLSGLYVLTDKIIVSITFHLILNIGSILDKINICIDNNYNKYFEYDFTLISFLFVIIIYLPIIISSIYLYDLINTLESSKKD